MDLHVIFAGLCLFVPNQTDKKMRILMPSHHEGGTHVDPHVVKLNYQGGTPDLRMEEWFLDLSKAGGLGSTLTVQDCVLDVGVRAQRKVDSQQWGKNARKSVVSHVILPPASKIVPGPLVNWKVIVKKANGTVISETPLNLTHQLTYIIKDVDVAFFKTWQREPLRPRGGATPQALPEPIPNGNTLILELSHVPVKDVPLNKGDESTHFQAFHNVFKVQPGQKAHVFLNEDPKVARTNFGGSPFNCMLAQSDPEP